MKNNKFPSFSQLKQIGKVLNKKERGFLLFFIALGLISLAFIFASIYYNNTKEVATFGGTYIEGVVGQPRFINPIYGQTNDIDRALIDLTFSGLFKYDKNGKIVPDLVSEYKISADGKVYSFVLKDNVFWHDGKPLTIDDVLFTIKVIQTPDYKSPQRANFIDVVAEKTSDKSFNFILKNPYNSFLENCVLKIIPKHIWENILPENFTLSSYNLKPIGSGMFQFENIKQANNGFIENIDLISNKKYYNNNSLVSKLTFDFFENENDLISAANQRTVDGFSLSYANTKIETEKQIKKSWSNNENFSIYNFNLPRYFAVFFNSTTNNPNSKILSDENIRKALSLSVDKKEIINQLKTTTGNNVSEIDSPILPEFFGFNQPTTSYEYDIEKAKSLFEKSGFKLNSQNQLEKIEKKTPAFQFKVYLAEKTKSKDVTELQRCLGQLGFSEDLQGETTGTYGQGTVKAVENFQKKYLPSEKVTGEVGAKTRQELNELCAKPTQNLTLLQFTITTINQPQLIKTAELLKDYWAKVGVQVTIKTTDLQELKTIIKERSYQALLYGESLGSMPDFYPFWHSSQKIDPGLNLSGYENKDVDTLLKEARETQDADKRQQDLQKVQNIILGNSPALFLYNTDFAYWVSQKVKGVSEFKIIDPAKRFLDIESWYIKTKRSWQ